jgi:iduronate 2-sulfatase
MSLFEESSRVPFLVVAPGAAKGAAVKTPVSHLDLFPTLAELCGVEKPANLQGQSLVPMLKDTSATGRGWALTQVARGGGLNRATVTSDIGSEGRRYFGYTLRTPRWRYTEWDEGQQGLELYDHDADPRELTNLGKNPAHAQTMRELASTLRSAVKQSFPPSGEMPALQPSVWAPNLTEP